MSRLSNIVIHRGDYLECFDSKQRSFLIDLDDWINIKDYYWIVHNKTHGHHKTIQREVIAHAYQQGKHSIIKLHRFLIGSMSHIDHINGNPLDNRQGNLRVCTNQENARNSIPKGGGSKFKGVSFCKQTKKWRAGITIDYKTRYIGRFISEEKAARAYDAKAIQLFGEFAKTNRELGLYEP